MKVLAQQVINVTANELVQGTVRVVSNGFESPICNICPMMSEGFVKGLYYTDPAASYFLLLIVAALSCSVLYHGSAEGELI